MNKGANSNPGISTKGAGYYNKSEFDNNNNNGMSENKNNNRNNNTGRKNIYTGNTQSVSFESGIPEIRAVLSLKREKE